VITDEQLDDMLHALGGSSTPKRENMGWRNRFIGPSKSWDDLVAKGFAERRDSEIYGVSYRVSDQGLKILGVELK
jgi:hypothetical protein